MDSYTTRPIGLSEGSAVIVKVDEPGALRVTSRSQVLAKVRREIRKYIPAGRDLIEELIRDRRADAQQEDERAQRL